MLAGMIHLKMSVYLSRTVSTYLHYQKVGKMYGLDDVPTNDFKIC